MTVGLDRVMLLIESGGPGGAERVVLKLATGLRDRGLEVAVVTTREGWLTDRLAEARIAHERIDAGGRLDPGFAWRIAGQIRDRGSQVLHSHLLDSNLYGAIAAKIAGVRHVATEHGDVHHTQAKKFLTAKVRLISGLGSQMTAVSQFTANRMAELGANSGRICRVGNPVEMPQARDDGCAERLRKEVGIVDPAHWLWTHVANLRPVKDQDTLLAGFAHALRLGPRGQTLCLLGDGDQRTRLEARALELGIGEQVHFLGFRDDVMDWLQASDGFVLSSRSEAMPMSLLEASLAGCFPVCTRVGGVSEVVIDTVTGSLVAAGDAQAMGVAMSQAAQRADRSRQMARDMQCRVEQEFGMARILDAYLDLYAGGGLPEFGRFRALPPQRSAENGFDGAEPQATQVSVDR